MNEIQEKISPAEERFERARHFWGFFIGPVVFFILLVVPMPNLSSSAAAKVNPLPPALGVCLGSSYGFMLPVSTPSNAIVYGSGLVPITRMIRAGILFDIIGFLLIVFGIYLLLPLLGLF